MNLRKRSVLRVGIFVCSAALSAWPLTASAQVANPPKTADAKVEKLEQEPVVLSPFQVNTSKDKGYAATNTISGSRVDTPIKDLPLPITVVTSEFISDIGATNLRESLSYVAGIGLQSQNDLENKGGIGGIQGSAYGPGGVNNPEGITSNISGTQLKIRGFITNNVLRDGFLRGSPSDSIGIDRIEVVQGPNALLYGTGNFGGVVDYLTKRPLSKQQSWVTFGYGMDNFMRATIDTTGPISANHNLNYRLMGAWEDQETNIDSQEMSHFVVMPSFEWRPTKTTSIYVAYEYAEAENNGFGFRALRAAQGTGGTPINNDQLEATGFYWPPGADRRTWNLSGPDTKNEQTLNNIELLGTQQLFHESTWVPQVDFLLGYNYSKWTTDTQDANGGIQQILPGNPGAQFGQTITITSVSNGLGEGVVPSNGNLQYGTFNNEVVRWAWNQNSSTTEREQVRAELTAKKDLFHGSWYQTEIQALGGYTELYNEINGANWQTLPGQYYYKGPLDLAPMRFGKNGDGSAGPALYQNDKDNINKGWDKAWYGNIFFKTLKLWGVEDRLIFMYGMREDKADAWSTDTQITAPTATPPSVATTTTSRAAQSQVKSKQYGGMVKITDSLSVFALKADGFQPNFGGLHESLTGAPVGADTAQSEEFGIKFDFFKGKVSGSISKYKITKNAWLGQGFSTPAPLGHVRFDPSKPIVYNLGDANGTGFFNPFVNTPYTTKNAQGQTVTLPGYVATGQTYTPNAAEQAAWIAAVNAGAVTLVSPINGQSASAASIYLNASKPEGAAWMDAFFAAAAPGWAGWPYMGNDINDPGINNATLDDGGFQNTSQKNALPSISEATGYDGTIMITPNEHWQFVLSGAWNSKVELKNKGVWIKYPYPQDRWATWYFPNGGFGLKGQKLNEAYTDPTDTSTRTNTGVFPGDDTPKERYTVFANYKFGGKAKGWVVGLGADYASKRAYFSGVTHGAGQVQTDTTGKVIVLYMPSRTIVNGFVRKDFVAGGHAQYLQLNVDNLLDDTDLYGQIYATGIKAKLTYGIAF